MTEPVTVPHAGIAGGEGAEALRSTRSQRPITPSSRITTPAKSEQTKGGDGDRTGSSENQRPADITRPVPVAAEPTQANGWAGIDSAPKTGKIIWLSDGKAQCEAVWRPTRQFRMEKNSYGKWLGKWFEAGYWSAVNFSGTRVPFTPKFWHEQIR